MKTPTITKSKELSVQVCGPASWRHGAFRVHASTCSHAKRDMELPNNGNNWGNGWEMKAFSLREIAVCIYSDMIDEGSMTEQDALADVEFCNCVKLPMEAKK